MNKNPQQYSAPASKPVLTISLSPDDEMLAIGQLSGRNDSPTLSIVQPQTGEVISVVEKTKNSEGSVYRVLFHPDRENLFYIIQQKDSFRLKRYDLTTKRSKKVMNLGMQFRGLAVAQKGNTLMALGNSLHLWEEENYRTMPVQGMSSDEKTFCAGLSPNGNYVAVGGQETGQVAIFETKQAELLHTLSTSFEAIGRIEFDHSSCYIGAMNELGQGVYVWDIKSGRRYKEDIFSEELALTSSFRFSARSDYLILGHVRGYVVIHDLKSGDEVFAEQLHEGRVEDVCLSSDGQFAISAGEDHQIVIRKLDLS